MISKVLLFQSEPLISNQFSVHGYIEKIEFKIINQPPSGHELIHLIIGERPELIITDLIFPKNDGLKIIETIKKDRRTLNIPIVVYSNYTEPFKKAKSLGAMECVIIAEVEPSKLVKKINTDLISGFAAISEESIKAKFQPFFNGIGKLILGISVLISAYFILTLIIKIIKHIWYSVY